MATTEQLLRVNAPQLVTATDRLLHAAPPRRWARASHEVIAPREAPATASRVRSWILIAMVVVAASVAAALVGHTGPEVLSTTRCGPSSEPSRD
jgi:hypothetical protein